MILFFVQSFNFIPQHKIFYNKKDNDNINFNYIVFHKNKRINYYHQENVFTELLFKSSSDKYTEQDLEKWINTKGININFSVNNYFTSISFFTTKKYLEENLKYIEETIFRKKFKEKDFYLYLEKTKKNLENDLITKASYYHYLTPILKDFSLNLINEKPKNKGFLDLFSKTNPDEVLNYFKEIFQQDGLVFIESSDKSLNIINDFIKRNSFIKNTDKAFITQSQIIKKKNYYFLFENEANNGTSIQLWNIFNKSPKKNIAHYSFLSSYFFENLGSKFTQYLRMKEGLVYSTQGHIDSISYKNKNLISFSGTSSQPVNFLKKIKEFFKEEPSIDQKHLASVYKTYPTKLILSQESFQERVLKFLQEKIFNFSYETLFKENPNFNEEYKEIKKSFTQHFSFFATGPKEQLDQLKKAYPEAIYIKDPRKFLEEELYKIF